MKYLVRVGSPTLVIVSSIGGIVALLFVWAPVLVWVFLVKLNLVQFLIAESILLLIFIAFYARLLYQIMKLKRGNASIIFEEHVLVLPRLSIVPDEIESVAAQNRYFRWRPQNIFIIKFRQRKIQLSIACHHHDVHEFTAELRRWVKNNEIPSNMNF